MPSRLPSPGPPAGHWQAAPAGSAVGMTPRRPRRWLPVSGHGSRGPAGAGVPVNFRAGPAAGYYCGGPGGGSVTIIIMTRIVRRAVGPSRAWSESVPGRRRGRDPLCHPGFARGPGRPAGPGLPHDSGSAAVLAASAMRFESHFKSYFGNVKAFNLKKIKIISEPVAAMTGGGPAAGGRWQANSLGRA